MRALNTLMTPVPRFWQGHYDNSGWTVGRVDDKGELTGDDIAYIYPDMKNAIKVRRKCF